MRDYRQALEYLTLVKIKPTLVLVVVLRQNLPPLPLVKRPGFHPGFKVEHLQHVLLLARVLGHHDRRQDASQPTVDETRHKCADHAKNVLGLRVRELRIEGSVPTGSENSVRGSEHSVKSQ